VREVPSSAASGRGILGPVPSTASQRLIERLEARQPIVFDGGMRGALGRRGLASPDVRVADSAAVLSSAPHVVSAIHARFCAAGVHVLRANTLHTTPSALARSGYGYRAAKLTSYAVDLAVEAASACGRPACVCGVLAPTEDDTDDRLRAELVAQAQRLLQSGCEAIYIDAARSLRSAVAATAAAAETGLPVLVALAVEERGVLHDGESLEVACGVLSGVGARGFFAVPSEPAGEMRAVAELGALGRPWGVFSAGTPAPSALSYGARAFELSEEGASLFGGEEFVSEQHVQAAAGHVPGAERDLYRFTLSPAPRASLPSLWSRLPPRK
jgi:S-methylmethionine-dependent homocysteine/selenocysteine methylase